KEPREQQRRHTEHEESLKADRGDVEIEDPAHLRRHAKIVAAGDRQEARLEERRQSEREHEIERSLRSSPQPPLERRDQERIDAEPEEERADSRPEDACGTRQMQEHDGREGEIAANSEELAVSDVDHVEHAKDQREPDGEERVEPSEDDALNEELEK